MFVAGREFSFTLALTTKSAFMQQCPKELLIKALKSILNLIFNLSSKRIKVLSGLHCSEDPSAPTTLQPGFES